METTTTVPPPRDYQPKPFLVQPQSCFSLHICPTASSSIRQPPGPTPAILAAVSCQRWGCPHCARAKISRLAAQTVLAAPNRLLTLTIDPSWYESPRAAFEKTAKLVPELIRKLRLRFGSIEYLRVTEVTKKGWPHYHLLVRSSYLPHIVVKSLWEKMTRAHIVDLRQVTKSFSAYYYLVKYLSKMHRLDWTERHLSTSKDFFPPKQPQPKRQGIVGKPQFLHIHPIAYLAEWYRGQTITQIGATQWSLDQPTSFCNLTPDEFTNWGLDPITTQLDHQLNPEPLVEDPDQQPLTESRRHEF